MHKLIFMISCSLLHVAAYGQVSLRQVEHLQPVDSVELESLLMQYDLTEQMIALHDSLSVVFDSTQVRVDSLRLRAAIIAEDYGYNSRQIAASQVRLRENQGELTKTEKKLSRHENQMQRYQKQLDFVKVEHYYPYEQDKWAKRVFWGGVIAFYLRMAIAYVLPQGIKI